MSTGKGERLQFHKQTNNVICRGVIFKVSSLRLEVNVRFVDIRAIMDYHCLNKKQTNVHMCSFFIFKLCIEIVRHAS